MSGAERLPPAERSPGPGSAAGVGAAVPAGRRGGAPALHAEPDAGLDAERSGPPAAREPVRKVAGNGVIQVVQGAKRIGCVAYELQLHAAHRVRGVAKPPYSATSTLDSLESRKLAEGVRYQVLYDRAALARPPQLDITTKLVSQGEQARVLHMAPTKLLVIDDEVALMPLMLSESAVESSIVVRGSAMLAALGQIFDDMWRFAAPFTGEHELAGEMHPTDEERWILSLLASGATDETIGRLMGYSPRTAHRRVRDLVARLGVETRFQAGMQAVKLGWL
ncbi:helix-turn-helix transcriptional regulator [Bounagaea algeriensis]